MAKNLEELARSASRGDAHAFAQLYGECAGEMYRFALYMLGHVQDAEDAVQEACLSAYGSISSLRDPGSFKSWIFRILSNICKTKLSQRKRVVLFADYATSGFDRPDPADEYLSVDVMDALDRLTEEDRRIVLLHAVAGYTSREIAEMTDLPAGTVRSRLSRANAKLRELLCEEAE